MTDLPKIFAWLSVQNLTGEELKILLNLMGRLNYDNYVKISQIEIAGAMNLHKTRISKAINHMVRLHILLEGAKEGIVKSYRLNPYMADDNPTVLQESDREPEESSMMPLTHETQSMLQRINKRSGKV